MTRKSLRTRINYLIYDIHARTDLFHKQSRCRRFLYRAFALHPKSGLTPERVDEYISEAEHGDHPWKDFFRIRGRPWAIDWAMLAMDYLLWLKSTEEYEAESERELAKTAEQYYAYTGEQLPEEENN